MTEALISDELTIQGDLTCTGSVKVSGRIEGNITAGRLEIMEGGEVKGSVEADDFVVHGTYEGKATCTSVAIANGARVASDIAAKSLSCERGAELSGELAIVRE